MACVSGASGARDAPPAAVWPPMVTKAAKTSAQKTGPKHRPKTPAQHTGPTHRPKTPAPLICPLHPAGHGLLLRAERRLDAQNPFRL